MDEKTILEGRIYPSIKNSVNNRYLLLLGFFAVYGFLYISSEFRTAVYTHSYLKWGLFLFWSLLSLHNYINYLLNAKEQRKKEKSEKNDDSVKWWSRIAVMELMFMAMFIGLSLAWLFLPTAAIKSATPESLKIVDSTKMPMFIYYFGASGDINIWDKVAKWSSALLTPVIGIVAAYIAWQQYQVNKKKLKHELYDRRLRIYEEVNKFIRIMTDKPCTAELIRFHTSVSEAFFLFGPDIPQYLNEVFEHGNKRNYWQRICRDINSPTPAPADYDHNKVVEGIKQEDEWLIPQIEFAKEKFAKYLKL